MSNYCICFLLLLLVFYITDFPASELNHDIFLCCRGILEGVSEFKISVSSYFDMNWTDLEICLIFLLLFCFAYVDSVKKMACLIKFTRVNLIYQTLAMMGNFFFWTSPQKNKSLLNLDDLCKLYHL